MSKFLALFLLILPVSAQDLDRDGIDDLVEQQLLRQFLPTFYIATEDCDGQPAEFVRGKAEPVVKDRNGAIYGQVFPVGSKVEIHYYHLWAADCGGLRTSHPLDAESVSLLAEKRGDAWVATHWFASAHEDTLCDVSNAVNQESRKGVEIWVSKDKHASFLSKDVCRRSGCGKDRCDANRRLEVTSLVNIGEVDAWLNESAWAGSAMWNLREKMKPNFADAAFVARIGLEPTVMASRTAPKGAQTTIKVAGTTYASLETANQNTTNGLATATSATSRALSRSTAATKRALRRAFQWR
ncbi:hypothetical protein F183_A49500 [Bryobacterales bacterium F-183]|nr:hypothetical protein F183_A49500 [Bryobacterales bacterium F-183]